MLKAETLKKIAALLKLKEADLEAAIKDEKEADLAIDDKISSYTEDEITTLKKNTYNEAKAAGEEMAVDAVKKDLGLDFTGKTVKGLADAVAKKTLADAKIEPEKKVSELQAQNELLKKAVQDAEEKATKKEQEVEGVKLSADLSKLIPAGTTIAQEKVLGLMKMDGYEAIRENGKIIYKKNGETIKGKLGDPLEANEVISTYVTENRLVAEAGGPGGRGNGNEGGSGKAMKMSDIKTQFEKEGKSLLGEEFQKAVAAAVKENPEFVME
jgi:ribosomal protein S13